MTQYYRSPENPHARSVEFFAVNESTNLRDGHGFNDSWYTGMEHPVSEVSLQKGGYTYGDILDSGEHNTDKITSNRLAKPGDQLKLFGVHPSVIETAYADYRMQANTPTVLGMAINEAKNIGTGLTYSEDLSEHSSRFAKYGMEAGVVSPNPRNPRAEQENNIADYGRNNYVHGKSPSSLIDYDLVPLEEVKAGRETIRGIVKEHRQAKKPHMGPQFKHPDLDVTWYQPELGQ